MGARPPLPSLIRRHLSRTLGTILGLALLVLAPLTLPANAWADGIRPMNSPAGSTAFDQGPASSDQLALYARIASVNTCIAAGSGQDFEQAAGVAGETIAQLILGVHQGLLATSGTIPLTLDELRRGSVTAAVIGATEICPKEVPDALKTKVQQALNSDAGATPG